MNGTKLYTCHRKPKKSETHLWNAAIHGLAELKSMARERVLLRKSWEELGSGPGAQARDPAGDLHECATLTILNLQDMAKFALAPLGLWGPFARGAGCKIW